MNAVGFLRRVKRRLSGSLFTKPPSIGLVGTQNLAARETWLEQTLKTIPAGSRILDAGAGELKYKPFCAHLDYVSQDFGDYTGAGNALGLQTGQWDTSKVDIISDIRAIPEPDASFDAIMCIEVLEHLPARVDALRELARLLKPGGTLIVTAPFCSLTHFAPFFFQTGYSRYFYEHWLEELGFEIEDMRWNGNYFEYIAQELRRVPEVAQQYAHERPSDDEWTAVQQVLGLLNRLSQHDKGSEQFLCYGLQVKARKKI